VYVVEGDYAESIVAELRELYPDKEEHRVRADEGNRQIIVVGSDRTHSEVRALIRLAEEARRPQVDKHQS
jgi:hypothetical protein